MIGNRKLIVRNGDWIINACNRDGNTFIVNLLKARLALYTDIGGYVSNLAVGLVVTGLRVALKNQEDQ